jgi:hypothetical protein
VKGKTFEREVANSLKPLFPGAKRGIGQARSASEVADVTGVPLFWIECKRYQKPVAIKQAMKQACDAADQDGSGKLPVVVSREDHEKALATMLYDDWQILVEDYFRLKRLAGEE